jgi:hypothetical protein
MVNPRACSDLDRCKHRGLWSSGAELPREPGAGDQAPGVVLYGTYTGGPSYGVPLRIRGPGSQGPGTNGRSNDGNVGKLACSALHPRTWGERLSRKPATGRIGAARHIRQEN